MAEFAIDSEPVILEQAPSTGRCVVPLCVAAPDLQGLCVIHQRVRRAAGSGHTHCHLCRQRFVPTDVVTIAAPVRHLACPARRVVRRAHAHRLPLFEERDQSP